MMKKVLKHVTKDLQDLKTEKKKKEVKLKLNQVVATKCSVKSRAIGVNCSPNGVIIQKDKNSPKKPSIGMVSNLQS